MLTNVKFVCTIRVKVHCTATAGTGQQLYLKENITKVYMMAFSFCHIMDHFFPERVSFREFGPIVFILIKNRLAG